jgi:hypothetical protein
MVNPIKPILTPECHIFMGVWLQTGYGLVNGFTDHLYASLETTLYRTLTHTDLCHQSITVSTSRFLATASTKGNSSASHTQVHLPQQPVQNSCQLTIQLIRSQAGGYFTPTSLSSLHRLTFNWTDNWTLSPELHWPCLKHFGMNHIENTVSTVTVQQYLDRCMRIRCHGNLFSEQLPSDSPGIVE